MPEGTRRHAVTIFIFWVEMHLLISEKIAYTTHHVTHDFQDDTSLDIFLRGHERHVDTQHFRLQV